MCERLVHPSASGEDRSRQQRLLGTLLAGPFVLAAAVAQAVMPAYGASWMLAAICATFGLSWLGALYSVTRGQFSIPAAGALAGGSILISVVVVLSGGAASPAALLLLALPVEAYWITRSRKSAVMAAVAGFVAVLFAGTMVAAPSAPVDALWLWAAPALYMATLAARWFGKDSADASAPQAVRATISETALDAAVARLSRSGEVESMSAKARDLLSIEPEMLLGSGLFERVHVADRVAYLCALSQVRETRQTSHCEVRIRMPVTAEGQPGGFRPFHAEFLHDETDGVVAILRDGREIEMLRRELAEAREQANKTEIAKGRFLAAVSHELRTPLNAIIGFSDMLLHRDISGDLAPKQVEHVSLIREAGNHLLSVVNAILDVSKIESGSYEINVEPFDPQAAVDLCCAMLLPQAAAKNVTLAASVPHGMGDIAGDQRAFQQILINLVSNAIKFTPEGGSVKISAHRSGSIARIFVSDTGIGISDDDLQQLGRPFMQVQNDYTRQFQGTGLGLSLVKGLVALHGGSMSIESAPGLGTTVTIGLPIAEAAVSADNATSGTEMGETGENHGVALRKIA